MTGPKPDERRRDPQVRARILAATCDLLIEVGYVQLTIEGVARRAGVGKATIYRWWPSKGALLLEAAADHLAIGSVPDSGSTRDDLTEGARQLIRTFSNPVARRVIFVVTAQLDDDPAVAATFRERWVYPWRQSMAAALARGIARGDLAPNLDVELMLDTIVGTVFQRTLVMATPRTRGLAKDLVMLLLEGAAPE